jgi:protein-disulfide isomerase
MQRAESLARTFGISATPSIVVGGRQVTTPRDAGSYAAWLETIDRIVAIRGHVF